MDMATEIKSSRSDSLRRKSLLWSIMMILLLVGMFLSFDNVPLIQPQHVDTERSSNVQFVLQKHNSLEDRVRTESIGVFEIIGSKSNLNFMETMKSIDYDCGKVWENTNRTNTRVYVSFINETKGKVEITIETYNHFNQRKTVGGDIFVIWAEEQTQVHQPMSSRRIIAGSVTDNLNGTYTGSLQVHWSGRFKIYTRLLSISRTQCLRFKAMNKYGNSVFSLLNSYGIFFTFKKGNLSDSTRCGPIEFIYGYDELCNFTSLNYNYSYYCGHPSGGLNCSDVSTFNMRKYNLNSQDLKVRRSEDDIIYDPGWGKLTKLINITISKNIADGPEPRNYSLNKAVVSRFWSSDVDLTDGVLDKPDTLQPCHNLPILETWSMSPEKIYIQNNSWRRIGCKHTNFSETNIKQCLANKKLFFIGDSTVRQYVDAIGAQIKQRVNYFPFHVKLYSEHDKINITWRKHELPFHNVAFRDPYQINSTDNQLKDIANDSSIQDSALIIVLTYNTHLQAFPPYIFRDRINKLVTALKYLVTKKPLATVFFKGPHITNVWHKWFDARMSLIYMEIIKEEFASIQDKVRYLDVFTLSVLNDDQSLHPTGQALVNQLQQFLSYICP